MLKIDISGISNIVKMLYTDRITVWDHIPAKRDNYTQVLLNEDATYKYAPCLITYLNSDDPLFAAQPLNEISVAIFITLPNDTPVKAGQYAIAEKLAADGVTVLQTHKGILNKPNTSSSHQELLLMDREWT